MISIECGILIKKGHAFHCSNKGFFLIESGMLRVIKKYMSMHVVLDWYFHIGLVSSMPKSSKSLYLSNFTLVKEIIKVKCFY
jgi:hypothetical protein